MSGRIGANRSIEFDHLGSQVESPAAAACRLALFRQRPMAALYIPGVFLGLAQGLRHALARPRDGSRPELAGSASGAMVFSQFFWPAALQQLTGMLADGTWVPMATVHFAAMTAALLAGWIAVRAKG